MNRPGWDWHPHKGDFSGHWSVSVNGNWRLTITFVNGDASWMICIIMLARGPFLEGRLHAWNTIALPLSSWFLIDKAFSIAHGVWGNVLLNTATGMMFGIPLLFSRRHFSPKH